jgi:hypothetical protein
VTSAVWNESENEWQQGSLLPADVQLMPVAWVSATHQLNREAKRAHEKDPPTAGAPTPTVLCLPIQKTLRFAVITHTCDVVKPGDDMPLVEVARVFTTDNPRVVVEASNVGSAKYFCLSNPGAQQPLILDYRWRTFLDKGILAPIRPDNSVIDTWDAAKRKGFTRWLGQRLSRPALSNEDVESISSPIRLRWRTFCDEEPELARLCTEAYGELRFRRETGGTLRVFLLASSPSADEDLALEFTAVLGEALGPHQARVSFDPATYGTFTMQDFVTSHQIDMDWASHEEATAVGELPPVG